MITSAARAIGSSLGRQLIRGILGRCGSDSKIDRAWLSTISSRAKFAKRRPEFNRIGWRIEAWAIGALIGVLRLLPLETATRFAHWTVRSVRSRIVGKRVA